MTDLNCQSTTLEWYIWQSRAREFIRASVGSLWEEIGEKAREYLHRRGLRDDTIKNYSLGYNLEDRYEPAESWGISNSEVGRQSKIWIPRGIVIPCVERENPWYLKIRRPVSTSSSPKYVKVKGSRKGVFGVYSLRGADIALFTEGEFDAMLLEQEAGDMVGAATLGSAYDRLERLDLSVWGPHLIRLKYILTLYDNDVAGMRGAKALNEFSARVFDARLPEMDNVKDVTDFCLAGEDLAELVVQVIKEFGILNYTIS